MIVAPFDLLKLPKLPLSPNHSVPVFAGNEHLFVGVSSSAVNKLSFRPPQVLSAHAVAPGTIITAIAASEPELVVYGSIHRGKHFLNVLNPHNEDDGVKNSSLELPDEIGAIHLSADKFKICVIGKKTSSISVFLVTDLSQVSLSQDHVEDGELIYSGSIDLESSDESTFILLSRSRDSLRLRTLALDSRSVHTLLSVDIKGNQTGREAVADSYFSHAKDLLYQTNGTKLYIYRIPEATIVTEFELEGHEDISGIIALPNNNVAIARGHAIDLIDCTFQSHISTFDLGGNGVVNMLGFFAPASTIVAMQGQESIIGLSVTPTQGTLLESLGKGSAQKIESYALSDIFAGFSEPGADWKKTAEVQLLKANKEVDTVLTALKDFISKKDGASFAQIVTYLKNPELSWEDWQKSGSAAAPEQQDLVYEEADRNADRRLIREVCELTFLPRLKSFLPIGVAVYLLTHPLFPAGEPKFERLLPTLEKSDPILYRQAIVSLTGIGIKDLILGLISTDRETFLDAAMRLQEDYGSQQILYGIREAFGKMRSISSLSIVIERLSRHSETIGLMRPFIDSMGMLAWDVKHIDNLQVKISQQIKSAESCIEADAAITELFNVVGLDAIESAVPSSAAELRNTRNQLNSITGERESHMVPKHSIETLTL